MPQTTASILADSSRSSPYCGDFWRRYCCLTSFFPIVDTCLSCEDIARQSCTMVPRWRLFGDILRPALSASRVQHVSDPYPKFVLRPHHVWKYGRHPISDRSVHLSCPVCDVWPNGWMNQDETWHALRPRPWPHCVRWGPSSHSKIGGTTPNFRPTSIVAKRMNASGYHLVRR